ncbi:hypothetical protein V3O24_08630 [Methylobacter sp. Wu8]
MSHHYPVIVPAGIHRHFNGCRNEAAYVAYIHVVWIPAIPAGMTCSYE